MPDRLVVLAPNWLGDAVLALPALADLRRASPAARLAVAARESVAGLFRSVSGVDDIVTFGSDAGVEEEVRALAAGTFDTAVLFPNSFHAAWLAWRAGIRNRWGYRANGRTPLLTRGVPKPADECHQSEYYQRLTGALGIDRGPREPSIEMSAATRAAARERLTSHGYEDGSPLVVLAPGAAYGTAKQWIPEHVAALIASIASAGAAWCVLVGSRGDAATAGRIRAALPPAAAARLINLTGETTLDMLMGVLAAAAVCVSNDSGAMHLAAALGTPVVGIFGPTNERQTSPVARPDSRAVVLTHEVWCRPCMLRECPIDHGCMTAITPDRVFENVRLMM